MAVGLPKSLMVQSLAQRLKKAVVPHTVGLQEMLCPLTSTGASQASSVCVLGLEPAQNSRDQPLWNRGPPAEHPPGCCPHHVTAMWEELLWGDGDGPVASVSWAAILSRTRCLVEQLQEDMELVSNGRKEEEDLTFLCEVNRTKYHRLELPPGRSHKDRETSNQNFKDPRDIAWLDGWLSG